MNQKLHSVKEVAAMLPVKTSNQKLYHYLKKLEIVSYSRVPSKRYVDVGYLELIYASKCKYQKIKHPTTMFTDKGVEWLLNVVYPDILILEANGFFDENLETAA